MIEPRPPGAGLVHVLELVGVAGFLACLGWFLLHSYSLIVFSDPMEWYLFGRDFSERFADTRLAYGFPLLMSLAVAAVGPFKAYLLNVPVLIALAALLYVFARLHAPTRDPAAAALGGAAALGLLVGVDARLLLALVNPYRDGLSYAFLLLAGVLVIAASRRPRRATALAAGAGAALALASSTRETSLLMLGPFALYAAVSKWRAPELPWRRPALAFGLALALGCVPLLVQNQLAGAAAWVPGQAAEAYAEEGSLAPGIRLAQLSHTLPELANELRGRYGAGLLLALALGLVLGAWRRLPAVWALSAPAFLGYVLFYGGYVRRVTRYGFVADLFALCIAGAGIAVLADLVFARWRPPRALLLAALALAFGAAGWTALEQGRAPRTRLRLEGVERFVRDFEASVPPQATVIGLRPVTDLIGGFTRNELEVVRNYWDLQLRLPALFGNGERVLVGRGETPDRIVASRFDLVDTRSLDPADYGLQRHFGDEAIRVSRVVPWSRKHSQTTVSVPEPGAYLLGVDVGRLSGEPRTLSMILWGNEPVAKQPLDGLDYFAVSAPEAPRVMTVGLVSDRPVPARIEAQITPLRRPLLLDFSGDRLLPHLARFSWSFLQRPWLGHPSIAREGHIDVPTLLPTNAAFLVQAQIGLVPRAEPYQREITVEAAGEIVGQWTLASQAAAGRPPDWQSVGFFLHEPGVGDPRTRLHFSVRDAPPGDEEPALGVREIQVQRVSVRPSLRVEVSTPQAQVYLDGGFGALERRLGRWTKEKAALRLLVSATDEPGLLTVRYFSAGLIDQPPRPTFRFDGEPQNAQFSDARLVTAQMLLPPGALQGVEHRLEIEVPVDEGGRGILLESVRLHPFRMKPGGR